MNSSNDQIECGPLWPHLLLTSRGHIPGQIKSFTCVSPRDILIMTDDDKLYGCGRNRNAILGLGHQRKVPQPKQITQLEGKQIVDIQHGESHVLAFSKDGEVYAWGDNKRGQCGTGTISAIILTPTKVSSSEKFVSVRCGMLFNLALNSRGVVYGWGDNKYEQLGENYLDLEYSPVRVEKIQQVQGITAIQCGSFHSLAVTDQGEAYAWGSNNCGQLCNSDEEALFNKVPIADVKTIAAGSHHSLFLTKHDKIYACGDNEYGQLGSQTDRQSTGTPVMLSTSLTYKSVAAYGNVSVALSSCCYVWGQVTKSKKVCVPRPTQFNSVDMAFSYYLKQSITPNLVPIKNSQSNFIKNPLIDRIATRFNQPEGHDVQLNVKGKTLYCHRGYLLMVSPYFKQLLTDNTDKIIPINELPYSALFAYVHYLYSGSLDASPDQVIQLLQLSMGKCPDPVLQQYCVTMLQNTISVVNCCQLYQLAIQNRLQTFEVFILQFIHRNLGAVFASNGYQEMDAQLCKTLSLSLSGIISQQPKQQQPQSNSNSVSANN